LLPANRASLMINMDMIGRIRDRKVMVGGAPEGSRFRRILQTLGPQYDLDLDLSDTSVYGSSDHTSFKARQVPTLFFFSGLHADYHRPTDTWDKIDPDSTVRLLKLIADLTMIVGTPVSKPQFAHSILQRFNTASTSTETRTIMPITMAQE
jgi:Zn-dependent M28 family amino/carboxypeptidase